MRFREPGFTLIELLIVIAIILVITAIAVPNFLRSRMAANQASAVESLRTIVTAEATYASTYGVGYSATLGYLGPPRSGAAVDAQHSAVLDSVLSGSATGGPTTQTSNKSGYTMTYTPGPVSNNTISSYAVNADPNTRGITGTNSYFADQSGVIRQNSTAAASVSDPPVAG
jgi:type IV pilus assembly protein PilA